MRISTNSGLALAALLAAVVLVPSPGWATQTQNCPTEPTQNTPIVSGETYSGANCVISTTGDVDSFQFNAAAGETYVMVAGLGSAATDICLSLYAPGVPAKLIVSGCTSIYYGTYYAATTQKLTVAGLYTVVVTETGNAVVTFRLSLERQNPAPPDAVPLVLSQNTTGQVNPPTAQDVFTFHGGTTGTYKIAASYLSGASDVCFQVYQPDGTAAPSAGACTSLYYGTYSTAVNVTPTQNGTHTVWVWASGDDSTVNYNLEVSCLLGNCSSQPVTVSGQVTAGGVGLNGVTINVNGLQNTSTTTSASGSYSIMLAPGPTYTLSAALSGYSFSAPVTFSNLTANQTANFTGVAVPGLEFYPVTPCRLVDTRLSSFQSGFGTPSMDAGMTRTFPILSNIACGIPLTAAAYSLNVTVVTKGYLGYLTIWPAGQPIPNVSTLNSYSNNSTAVANAAIVPAGTNGAINVYVTDATDVILDVNGYFAPPLSTGLQFYSVTPCRLVDTRVTPFQSGFGPPSMSAGMTRTFPIPTNSACGIPATASAYSLNVTAIPQKTLGFLSIWPTGEPLPNVSTLNVYNPGTVVANAAIVPAGTNGAINTYVTDATDLVIDIDGYFSPANTNGLNFYPATPCRIADTRLASYPSGLGPPSMGAGTQRSFLAPASTCGVPSSAGAYSLHFTAVPQAPKLGIFTTWPTGQSQPNVSTMNSYNGSVVSNAAIVPAGANGAISIYVTDATDVLFDINGYFAK